MGRGDGSICGVYVVQVLIGKVASLSCVYGPGPGSCAMTQRVVVPFSHDKLGVVLLFVRVVVLKIHQ